MMIDKIDNLQKLKVRKRLTVALIGLLVVILKDVFELPLDNETLNTGINLIMVYITGQSITDIFEIKKGIKSE